MVILLSPPWSQDRAQFMAFFSGVPFDAVLS